MKYYCMVIMLMFVPTMSAVDNAIVPLHNQPGALIIKLIDAEFAPQLAVDRARVHREIAWQEYNLRMHNWYKKVYPAGLLFLSYYEEPAKGAALAFAYLFQVL